LYRAGPVSDVATMENAAKPAPIANMITSGR
jgi:hypothetical protein